MRRYTMERVRNANFNVSPATLPETLHRIRTKDTAAFSLRRCSMRRRAMEIAGTLTSTFFPAALPETPHRIRTKDAAAFSLRRRITNRRTMERVWNANFDVFPRRCKKRCAEWDGRYGGIPHCRRSTSRRAMETVRRAARNTVTQRPCLRAFLRLTKLHFPALSQKCR